MTSPTIPAETVAHRSAVARLVAMFHTLTTPRTPTAQEYWGGPEPSAGWWRAL